MPHINLLPWREEHKKLVKQQYMTVVVLVALSCFILVFGVSLIYEARVNGQVRKQEYLRAEISVLDRRIEEIKELNKKKQALRQRMLLIEQLQLSRNIGTQVLDEIANIIPPGIYLVSMQRQEGALKLVGKSESNNRLANMMRNLEKSSVLGAPVLESIIAGEREPKLMSDFIMRVNILGLTSDA